MKSLDFVLSIGTAALLAGCGESQPPIGSPGTMPQSRAVATHAGRGGSWMLPEAKGEDLLYVSSPNVGVYVYSYPQGKLVGTLTGFGYAVGECSDADGNAFVTDNSEQDVVEYAHGGASPIATFNDSGNDPLSCAVDPMSHDLAVAGGTTFSGGKSTLAVFTSPSGPPTVYSDSAVAPFYFCTYETNGDLFVEGGLGQGPSAEAALDELPKGGDALGELYLNKRVRAGGAVQWDGEYLAFGSPSLSGHGPSTVYQLQISGSSATVANTIKLRSSGKRSRNSEGEQFWIQGDAIISPEFPNRSVAVWKYPAGGKVESAVNVKFPFGVTVSVAPSS